MKKDTCQTKSNPCVFFLLESSFFFFITTFYMDCNVMTSSVLTDQQLDNLKLYKYSSIDRSLLTKYVLRHYWDVAVKLFPLNMA